MDKRIKLLLVAIVIGLLVAILSISYDIYLSEVVNTFTDKTDLVYEITSTDGD